MPEHIVVVGGCHRAFQAVHVTYVRKANHTTMPWSRVGLAAFTRQQRTQRWCAGKWSDSSWPIAMNGTDIMAGRVLPRPAK
eukprot:scaffold29672_cov15-Prasinocladus_malaysianus.AAC.1